jgi:U2 small nuclear ribonucleoprotein B''
MLHQNTLTLLQKIQYAKGKSDFVSKLDGTFKIPITALATTAGANIGERSELQQSIFAAPPGAATTKEKEKEKALELPKKPEETHAGTKRPRDEDDEDDAPMDEDDDEGADMEMDESD